MKGCACGNRAFLYFRRISDEEAEKIKREQDVREVKGTDIWNIQVKDGVYDINVASLMKNEPVIVSGDEGRYILSLSSAFKGKKKKIK